MTEPDTTIRVVLVDDQEIVRLGFRAALEEGGAVRVVAESPAGSRAEAVIRRHRPDVVLADVRDEQALGALRRAVPGGTVTIAVLTAVCDDARLVSALRAGASGFLLKNMSQPELVQAVRALSQGHSVISPAATSRLIDRFVPLLSLESAYQSVYASLTEREIEVLVSVGAGMSNQEIAADLHLALPTVKSHLSNIFSKLGLRNRVHAALLAEHAGLNQLGQRRTATAGAVSETW